MHTRDLASLLPVAALCVGLVACGSAKSPPEPPPPASPEPAAPPPSPTSAESPAEAPATGPTRCGALDCLAFASPEDAFARVLESEPLVLAIGEAHAQKGAPQVASSTHRFTEQLLPKLGGTASDLVLEIWVASGACGKQEKQVAKQQKDVTEKQASTNQNEFVKLGNATKALGIQPHVLRPSCEEYEHIVQAGPNDIAVMLEMIARLTREKVTTLLDENASQGEPERMVVAYGGAMHNDVEPREGREAWSFGPALVERTDGRYVELDLIVPEFIQDTAVWRALPWHAHYDKEALGDRAVLYRPNDGSYVLIFPESAPSAK